MNFRFLTPSYSVFYAAISILGLSAVLLLLNSQSAHSEATAKVEWMSIEEAFEKVANNPNNQKKILVDLYTDWCGWCKRMDANTFGNQMVAKYLNDNYYCVKLDAEQQKAITLGGQTFKNPGTGSRSTHELAAKIGSVNGRMSYPTIAFLDEKFQLIQAIPGYRGPSEMMPILTYLAEDHYKNTEWESYYEQWQEAH